MYLDSTPLLGLPSAAGYSQVVVTQDQHLVVVFSLLGDPTGNFGKDLAEELEHITFNSSVQIHTYFQDVLAAAQAKEIEFQWALAYSNGTQVLFEAYSGIIILKRGSKVGTLLDTTATLGIKEGKAQAEDELVLLTQVGRVFTGEIILKFQQGYDLETTLNSVVSGLHSSDQANFAALSFTRVSQTPFGESLSQPFESAEPEEILDTVDTESERATPPEAPELNSLQQEVRGEERVSPTATSSDVTSKPVAHISPARPSIKFDQVVTVLQRGGRQGLKLLSSLQLSIRQIISQKDVYIGQAKKKEVARIIIAGAIILLLLIAGSSFFIWRRSQQKAAAQNALAPLQAQLVGIQAGADPIQARQDLETLLPQYRALKEQFGGQSVALHIISEETARAEKVLQDISGQTPVSNLPVLLDLRAVEPGSIVSKVTSFGNTGYFLDKDKQIVFKMDFATNEVTRVSVPDITDVRDLAADEDTIFILGSNKVWSVGQDGVVTVALEGETTSASKLVGTYNENLYLFSPERRTILRSIPEDDGYSDVIGWLRSFPDFEFDTATSMSIDGQVWVGTREGGIYLFGAGQTQSFTVTGLPEPFNSPVFIATQPDFENIYILEPAQKRLVILRKDGTFVKQITSAELMSASGIAINQEENTAYVVSGSLIYSTSLL